MEDFLSCDICYENDRMLHELSCCNNTKKICQSCLDALRIRCCPYCRTILNESLFTAPVLSSSAPSAMIPWDDYLFYETNVGMHLMNNDFTDSRIIRRQIGRARRRYLTEYSNRNRNNSQISSRERRHSRRQQRHELRNYTREATSSYNNEIFHLEL